MFLHWLLIPWTKHYSLPFCRCSWSPRASTSANSTWKNLEQHYCCNIVDCVHRNGTCCVMKNFWVWQRKLVQKSEADVQRSSIRNVLKILQNSQQNICPRVCLFFWVSLIKLQAVGPQLRKRVWCRCFPVEFASTFLAEHLKADFSKN